MERHGIEIFNLKIKMDEKGKKPLIWFIGFILNNTIFIYQLAGTYFAGAGVYSSVFGIGLIALLIYSVIFLKEKMTSWDWIGSGLIIAGTLIIGFTWITRGSEFFQSTVNWDNFYTLMIITCIVLPITLLFSRFTKKNISLFFGLAAGTCGAIDNVWKHLGLSQADILVILLSFAIGSAGFLITQWGFVNNADASKLVPCYNSTYIIIPILFESWIIPSIYTQILPLQIIAIVIIIFGIFCMTTIKSWRNRKKNGDKNGSHI